MTDTHKNGAQEPSNTGSNKNTEKKHAEEKTAKGGVKLFWLLVIGGLGVFLYTANEGQDNMFEDMAELFGAAKSKVTSLAGPSPAKVASQIIKRDLKSPGSFKLQKSVTIWSGQNKNAEPAYMVLVDYSALNGFGGAVRGCHLVSYYQAKDGQAKWNRKYGRQTLELSTCRANLSASQKRELAKIFIKPNGFIAN